MHKLRKVAAVAALLLPLSACGPAASAPESAPVELVAYSQPEAFALCKTLPEYQIPDCLTAAANW